MWYRLVVSTVEPTAYGYQGFCNQTLLNNMKGMA